MEEKNQLYSPGEVAELIGVSTSTIRRLTSAIEEKGYTRITRDKKNHRRYDLTDIRTLEYLHARINKEGYTQDEAVQDTYKNLDYILNKIDPMSAEEKTGSNEQIRDLTNKVNKLIEIVGIQNNEIKELKTGIGDLQATNERLNEVLNNRLEIGYGSAESVDSKEVGDDVSDKDHVVDQTTIDDYISDDESDIGGDAEDSKEDDHNESLADYNEVKSYECEPEKKRGILSRLFGRK